MSRGARWRNPPITPFLSATASARARVFRRGARGAAPRPPPYPPPLCGSGERAAEIFLEGRVQTLGAFFTPLVLALLLAFAAALLVLLPSLLEEIAPTPNVDARGVRQGAPEWARRLGGWLSAGVRSLGTAARDPGALRAVG